jgi:hypothetical protein
MPPFGLTVYGQTGRRGLPHRGWGSGACTAETVEGWALRVSAGNRQQPSPPPARGDCLGWMFGDRALMS